MNLGNIQTDTAVRVAAIICIILGFVACLIVMVAEYITHGPSAVLPALVNTVITSVLTFAVAALSSHQGAQIQQQGTATGATTVQDTTEKAAVALEKVTSTTNGTIQEQKQAIQDNTQATIANTEATQTHG